MVYERVPLFPLNTVLFPRMPLPLHIFEDRYKRMVSECVHESRPFGVVLIREGSEVGPGAVPYPVGTLAQLHAVNPLSDGRIDILTVGTDRFRLLDHVVDAEPYLVGVAEPLRDEPGTLEVLDPLAADATAYFQTYLETLFKHAGVDVPEYDLPDSPEDLSFVIAAVMQIDNARRQELLEMTDTAARLQNLQSIMQSALDRLRRFRRRIEPPTSFLSPN